MLTMALTAIRTAASALLGGPAGLAFGLQEDEIRIFEVRVAIPDPSSRIDWIHWPWRLEAPFAVRRCLQQRTWDRTDSSGHEDIFSEPQANSRLLPSTLWFNPSSTNASSVWLNWSTMALGSPILHPQTPTTACNIKLRRTDWFKWVCGGPFKPAIEGNWFAYAGVASSSMTASSTTSVSALP
jgi:hypothetical protein